MICHPSRELKPSIILSRLYLRLVILIIIFCSVALLLIRVQPYEDVELRQFLQPEGCPMPCFMGVRPGVTTVEEAIKILEASGWVKPNLRIDEDGSQIDFRWNGHQPHFIMDSQTLTLAFSSHLRKIMQISFRLQATILVGDLYLSLGVPSNYSFPSIRLLSSGDTPYGLILFHQYEPVLINLITFSNCPVRLNRLLNQPLNRIQYNFSSQTILPKVSLKNLLRNRNCDVH